jgi:hypothetical protein
MALLALMLSRWNGMHYLYAGTYKNGWCDVVLVPSIG